jgi:exodeoxyribonuclease-3
MARIIAWNIRQGGGRRLDHIADALVRYEPDIVVLNEIRERTTPALRARLAAVGLSFAEHTSPAGMEGGTLVASRTPLRRLRACPAARVARHALLEVAAEPHGVIGAVYGPMVTPAHAPFWNALVKHAQRRARDSYLLIGDFNTCEAGVDAYKTPLAGSDQFLAIRAAGFVDLWRQTNGDASEHTWFSFGRGGVPLNGFRIDHALASPSLARRLTGCRYSHTEREARLSDHSMLVVDLDTT